MNTHSELPALHGAHRILEDENIAWYDVKFYPYTAPGVDAVFAAVGSRYILVARLVDAAPYVEKLCLFKDETDLEMDPKLASGSKEAVDHAEVDCCLEWTQARNGNPLLIVSGRTAHIKIFDVIRGELIQTLVGHGGESVYDLAISPADPTILASASVDHGIRLWSLKSAHKEKPTTAILYNPAHKEAMTALAYHRTGRYLLSGAQDTRINLWEISDNLQNHMGTDDPAMLYYPHFSTTEIHTDYIDCIRWYGDLIFSKAARQHSITLWKIDNFSSASSPPGPAPVPPSRIVNSNTPVTVAASSISGTRSAWKGRFQCLLTFDLPALEVFYTRFSVFCGVGAHHVLAAGDGNGHVCFWDLKAIEEQELSDDEDEPPAVHPKIKGVGQQAREGSFVSFSSGTSGTRKSAPNRNIGDPFRGLTPDKIVKIYEKKGGSKGRKEKVTTLFRQLAWSNDGKYCLAAADNSTIYDLRR